MKIALYSATRNSIETTPFFKSTARLQDHVHISYAEHNTTGLSKLYNAFIDKCKDQYDYIVFVHDDVYIDDLDICSKLETAHQQFDIVGLAGGVNPVIQSPALWHLMCGGFGMHNLRGAVAHNIPATDQVHMTSFGPTPARVAIIDGLFISVKTAAIKRTDWKFNENYTFHHYDIASSLDANKKKLTIGVAPIWVIHKSPGLLDMGNKMYTASQNTFLREYADTGI